MAAMIRNWFKEGKKIHKAVQPEFNFAEKIYGILKNKVGSFVSCNMDPNLFYTFAHDRILHGSRRTNLKDIDLNKQKT